MESIEFLATIEQHLDVDADGHLVIAPDARFRVHDAMRAQLFRERSRMPELRWFVYRVTRVLLPLSLLLLPFLHFVVPHVRPKWDEDFYLEYELDRRFRAFRRTKPTTYRAPVSSAGVPVTRRTADTEP